MALLALRRRRSTRPSRRWRPSAPSASPSRTCSAPIPYAEMFPPEDPDYHPARLPEPASSTDVDRDDGGAHARAARRRQTRRCGPRRSAAARRRHGPGPRPTRPRTRTARQPVMVNVAAFYEGDDDKPGEGALGGRPRRTSSRQTTTARTSTSSPTRARADARRVPGQDLGPPRRAQAPLRPGRTCSTATRTSRPPDRGVPPVSDASCREGSTCSSDR